MTGLSKLNPKASDSSDDVSTGSISSESSESTDPGSMESEDPDMENYDEMLRNVENVLRIGAPDDDEEEEEELDEDILKEMCNFLMEQPDKTFKDFMEEEEAKVVELEDSDGVEEDSEDPVDPQKDSEDVKYPDGATMDPEVVVAQSELQKDSKDVKGEHSMRGTCRQNRSIVDSTEFFVPRVKFARTQSKYSIMIFMGVEKWTEFRVQHDDKERTIVSRFENTLDPQKATSYVSSLEVSHWVVALMVGLFSDDSILIGTLEWNIFSDSKSKENLKDHKELRDKLLLQMTVSFMELFVQYRGKTTVFRVKKTFTVGGAGLNVALRLILDEKDYLGYECLCGELVENPVCYTEHDTPKGGLEGRSQTVIQQFDEILSLPCYLADASTLEGITLLKFAKLDNYAVSQWKSINSQILRLGDSLLKHDPQIVGDIPKAIFVRHTLSQCGYWITVIPASAIEKMGKDFVRNYLSENKCRMGALCQKCSDPFDYWYHKNFMNWQLAVEDPTVPQPPTVTREPSTVASEVLNEVTTFLGKVFELSKACKTAYQGVDQILAEAQGNPLVYSNPEMVESVQTCRQFSDQLKEMAAAADTALASAQKVFGTEGAESEGPEEPEEPEEEPKVVELEDELEEAPKPKDQPIFKKMGRQLFGPGSEAARTTVFEDWDEKEENPDATVDFVEPEPGQFVEFMKRRRQHEIDQTEGNFERWIGLAIGMTLFFSALFILFYVCLWINSFF
ncbi:hypothetical protein CAEBREN_00249 [Caenorhabditis brenneri]|uniref:Uncharacterized protein n=1 Tax=Caenorhabditis brenneri TaxID=135651 RepID=G0N301_CAEBE|nr:hypothetical protein CAEBREN_00249 [Caenorhabditis brenneri]